MILNASEDIHNQQNLSRDASWLHSRAHEIIEGSRLIAKDGTEIWTPGANEIYNNRCYPRDFYYTVDACPDYFTDNQIKDVILYFLKRQKSDGKIPNYVNQDGIPLYRLYDNSQFIVNLVHLYIKRSKDIRFFINYVDKLEKAMAWLPINPITYMVTSEKPKPMYGFFDTIEIKGDDLFCSLLYYEAAKNMEEMYIISNNLKRADFWGNRSILTKCGLKSLYNNRTSFITASGNNNVSSVWGSAFALYLGITSESQNIAISRWLKENYNSIIQRGQIAHLMPQERWENTKVPIGIYQNGGFWATPFVWVYKALENIDALLADRMLYEILDDFQEYGINEVVNHELNYLNREGHIGNYCASLALLAVLREKKVKIIKNYKNLVRISNGGKVTASSVINDGKDKRHHIKHLNNGKYGNQYSWIPSKDDPEPWLMIELPGMAEIDKLVFGRDNWSKKLSCSNTISNRNGYSDRNIASFSLFVSNDGRNQWRHIFSQENFKGLEAGENCIINLHKNVICRYIKMLLKPASSCIDEIEAYGRIIN